MIIKSLHLVNIRSYEDATIEFPLGTTLFEGDIRSGKSTILYAIEFALFGLGSLKGAFLLKHGAKEGSVTLTFDVDGQEFEIFRGLKRKGKSVQQSDEGYIKSSIGIANLSAGELKERVLQILNFNEPHDPKAQSLIYRYAIFTPQDEMKEIITKEVDKRLQTLRRAYRIEDYKIASINAIKTTGLIKEKCVWLDGQTHDLEEKRQDLNSLEKKIEETTAQIGPLKKRSEELQNQWNEKQGKLSELRIESGRIEQSKKQIPDIKAQIADKTGQRDDAQKDLNKLNDKIQKKLEPEITELKKIERPTLKTKDELKDEELKLNGELQEKGELLGKIKERMGNFGSLIEKSVCPICERPLKPGDYASKLAHIENEKKKLDDTIDKIKSDIKVIDDLIDKQTKYELAQGQLLKLEPQLNESKEKIGSLLEKIPKINKAIEELQGKLKTAETETSGLDALLKEIEILGKESSELEKSRRNIEGQITGLRRDIKNFEANKTNLKNEIDKKESQLGLKTMLDEHRIWLSDYFIPTLENIEKHVMISINQRFNDEFQKWFQTLIEDPDMQVRIDEAFTPVIEQNGYEQDYFSLSGGEKTSVALAYRLALNTTVQEISTGMKSNLLILDEPTDGFSKEQVFRIRDILNELRCPQVIIVSHEKELESCADQVYKIQRTYGASSVNRVK